MFFMMMLTVCDVGGRYFFNSPLTGTTEITEMMMVIIIFPALGWAATNHVHVRVTILTNRFPEKVRAPLSIMGLILTFCVFVIITWRCFEEAMSVDLQSSLIHIPYTPFYWVMSIALAIFCLATLVVIYDEIQEVRKK